MLAGALVAFFYAIGAKVWDAIKPLSTTDCNLEKVKVTQLLCRAKVEVSKYVLRVVWLVIRWDVSKLDLVIRYVQYFKCTIHAKQLEAKATDADVVHVETFVAGILHKRVKRRIIISQLWVE